MEQTHAVVVMSEYLSMLEFIDNVKKDKIPIHYSNGSNIISSSTTFYTKDSAIKKLVMINNKMVDEHILLKKNVSIQEKEIERLKQFEPKIEIVETPKELSIEDIKKMGYFEFRKWKNKL